MSSGTTSGFWGDSAPRNGPCWLILAVLVVGASACECGSEVTSEDESASEETLPPIGRPAESWGVTSECATLPSPGLGDWQGALLVHGDSIRERANAVWVSGFYPGLELRSWADFRDSDRSRDLFIVGTPESVPLLAEMNGSLPVWFEDTGFTFGGYRYDEPGNGIAMVHPSPFSTGRSVRLHVGNTFAGAFSTFTIPTGSLDFNTTRGRSTVQQEGSLCRSGTRWLFVADWASDHRAEWELWLAAMETSATETHQFHYEPGSAAERDSSALSTAQTRDYAHVLASLEVAAVDYPIQTFYYPDSETKERVTGDPGNAHSNPLNYEVHAIYSDQLQATGPHEDVHVVAWHQIGEAGGELLGEGLAVHVTGPWWGQTLESIASAHKASGTLPYLETLISDFWSVNQQVSYPISGHFVRYLLQTHGLDTVKALYTATDLDQAFQAELGMSTYAVQQAWVQSID